MLRKYRVCSKNKTLLEEWERRRDTVFCLDGVRQTARTGLWLEKDRVTVWYIGSLRWRFLTRMCIGWKSTEFRELGRARDAVWRGDANVVIGGKKGSIKSSRARCARHIRRKRGSAGVCYVPYTPYRPDSVCTCDLSVLKEDRQTGGRAWKNEKKSGEAQGVHRRAARRRNREKKRQKSERVSQATLPEFSFSRSLPYSTSLRVLRGRPKRRIMWQGAREK